MNLSTIPSFQLTIFRNVADITNRETPSGRDDQTPLLWGRLQPARFACGKIGWLKPAPRTWLKFSANQICQ